MSQIGNIVSVASQWWAGAGTNDGSNWIVLYSYQLDAGGKQLAEVFVGGGTHAAVASWTSPTSTITVTPNPPGTTNPVVLACPPLVQAATFGLALK